MSRILITWELGDFLGHLGRYLPIARMLRQRGHEVLFALKEFGRFNPLITDEGFVSVQAPFYFDHEEASRELLNYSDILAANGFGEFDRLSGLMDGWSHIFREFRPDVVVAQSAPSSLLAACLGRIPVMRIDCGFGCPPDETPFPCFRPWLKVSSEDMLARELRVLNQINRVCTERSFHTFSSLQDVFKTGADLLITIPELDHYTGRRGGRYIGPILNLEGGAEIGWPDGPKPRIFVYLRQFVWLPSILNILSSCSCSVIAVLPGIGDELRCSFSSPAFRISTAQVSFSHLLETTDIAITHGGHGLASACLLAGVPMLIVPQVAEQLMTVYNFERLGIGKGVKHDEVVKKFEPALRRMLRESSYRENAWRLSQKYAGYDQGETLLKLCTMIEEKATGL